MKTYLVGGYVRDSLLKKAGYPVTPGDRDWVVVGATPEEMMSKGFIPVGKDFPVFLHPATHEEYALARTERKTGHGYHGFAFYTSPSVTLEEDLLRRDLTINAIAQADDGTLIDPYGGQQDLEKQILRHVSPAFSEDPVRILRVARFAARFSSFSLAPETAALLRGMVESGEADALVPERIWAELSKGFLAEAPLRMISILRVCGLWQKLFPEAAQGPASETCRLMEKDGFERLDLEARIALLMMDFTDATGVENRLNALRAPAACTKFAVLFHEISRMRISLEDMASLENLFVRSDALRRPERFLAAVRLMLFVTGEKLWEHIPALFSAWCDVDAGSIAAAQTSPRLIPGAILEARGLRLRQALKELR